MSGTDAASAGGPADAPSGGGGRHAAVTLDDEVAAALGAVSPDGQPGGALGGAGLDGGGELHSGDEVLTGRRLGRYRLGPVVHSGPMSTLYRADDVRLDRPVALKVISPLLAAEEEFRARFVEEARSLSAVDHPHVVPLYDHDEDPDGHLWLAMRWVDGATLAQAVAGTPLLLTRAQALFDQVASALDAVHACGLVHLDVKPANILITSEGTSVRAGRAEHVYLADFGLTRRGRHGGITAAGEFVGSPAFASPEHLRGEPVSAATDVYGLACALHTALTGRPPYLGSVREVISAHLAGQLRPASRVRGEVVAPIEPGLALGAAVDAELAWALAPDPADRPASAGELMAAVGAAMRRDATTRARSSRGPAPGSPPPPRTSAPPRPVVPGHAAEPAAQAPPPTAESARGAASVPGVGSVHEGAPLRRVRPPVAPSTEDLFTTSRPPRQVAPRDPRVQIAMGALLALVVLALVHTVLA